MTAFPYRVAYLRPADNVLRPFLCRLREVNQPVLSAPGRFLTPRSIPVGHPLGVRQPLNTTIIKPALCFRPSAAGATAAPERVTPLSTSTHDPSTPPPLPGCTAATPSLSHGRWWQAVRRVAGADSHEATQSCDRLGTGSTDLASLLRPGRAW